jgi:hypothetical protein
MTDYGLAHRLQFPDQAKRFDRDCYMQTSQVIAFLMPEVTAEVFTGPHSLAQGASALLRDAAGKITIEPVTKDSAFVEQMMTTGCFRRGKAIVDPVSRQIMGYEMEMISHPPAAQSDARAEWRPKNVYAL